MRLGQGLGAIWRQLAWSALVALIAAVVVGLWSDWTLLSQAFETFAWDAIPVAAGLTIVNATIRFGKWHYYARRVGSDPSWWDSAIIFVAGFALTVTPGKTGELLKAYFLSRRTGVAVWRAAPISVAERATDGFAIVILTGTGLTIIWESWLPVVLAGSGALVGCIGLAVVGGATKRLPKPIEAALTRVALLPLAVRLNSLVGDRIRESLHGASTIFDARSLIIAVFLGILSWGAESIALWYTLHAFGLSATLSLFGYALVALNAGTLAGAISLMPGGAGAADATIAGVLTGVVSHEVAGAATLIIRLCTVWFGAVLGIGALLALRDCFGPPPPAQPAWDAKPSADWTQAPR